MTHEDYKELLAANALTSLDDADARALETHLESCGDCRSEMNDWHQTAAFLALDVTPLKPSPELRDRILGSVRPVGRESESQRNDRGNPISVSDSKVLAFETPHRNVFTRRGPFGSWGSIAAGLALVALIISLFVLWQQNRKAQSELAKLSTQIEEAKQQIAREREAIEMLSSPGARMARLAGTDVAPGANAMLAYDKKGHAMLMAKGLPQPPKGMAYQLWFIVGNKPMPGKVFKTETSGEGMLHDEVPAEALKSAVFAITLEPESGMKAPTGAIYLRSAS
jgi:anti-sigma-K factor RskA